MATRKPIAALLEERPAEDQPGAIIVVCDDGAVFVFNGREDRWSELPPVPGTVAESPTKGRKRAVFR